MPGVTDGAAATDIDLDAAAEADPTSGRRLAAVLLTDDYTDDFGAGGGVDFDNPAAVRALLQAHGPPLGTVSRRNAETACRWLTEGEAPWDLACKIGQQSCALLRAIQHGHRAWHGSCAGPHPRQQPRMVLPRR